MDTTEFVSHLEELRKRLILGLAAFMVATLAAYFFSGELLNFLTEPLQRYNQAQLYFHKPYEAFLTHLKVAALTGLVVSSPILISQIWLFVAPGLYPKEKQALFPVILISSILFLGGAFFAYEVVIPWGLKFLLSFETDGLKPLLAVSPYLSFLTGMVLAFGVLFDFPVVLLGLVKLQVVSVAALKKARRIVILLIFIAAAILTPSPDPVSQLLLAGPLLLLFEISLILAKFLEKRNR